MNKFRWDRFLKAAGLLSLWLFAAEGFRRMMNSFDQSQAPLAVQLLASLVLVAISSVVAFFLLAIVHNLWEEPIRPWLFEPKPQPKVPERSEAEIEYERLYRETLAELNRRDEMES